MARCVRPFLCPTLHAGGWRASTATASCSKPRLLHPRPMHACGLGFVFLWLRAVAFFRPRRRRLFRRRDTGADAEGKAAISRARKKGRSKKLHTTKDGLVGSTRSDRDRDRDRDRQEGHRGGQRGREAEREAGRMDREGQSVREREGEIRRELDKEESKPLHWLPKHACTHTQLSLVSCYCLLR